jgi:hypothetical protein
MQDHSNLNEPPALAAIWYDTQAMGFNMASELLGCSMLRSLAASKPAGKYRLVDETLALLKPGGFYVVDDMRPQPNWPEGHNLKAAGLIDSLERRDDVVLTKLSWASGLVIAVKR